MLLTALLLALPARTLANDQIQLNITEVPQQPGPVSDVLESILTETIAEVLLTGESSEELLASDPVELAEAIRTGINIVIEQKGYFVSALSLNLDALPIVADLTVHPVGWTESDPHAVIDVAVNIDPGNIDSFWISRITSRLAEHPEVTDLYRKYLLGLPTRAADIDWALQIVLQYIFREDPSHEILANYAISYEIDIDSVASVTLSFEPRGDVIERIRPRMYSLTLFNFLLDRFRERLIAETDFLEGMPRSEIMAEIDSIEARLSESMASDPLMSELNAYASITIKPLESEPVVLIDALIESRTYDMSLETFVDFGNESRDSAEVQTRLGYLLARGFEVFSQLNYFTNDSDLKTDVGIGFRPYRGSFIGVGYDLDHEYFKYYLDQELYPGLNVRAEIFEDDDLNEFGMIYLFQQYLAGGAFTNGDNEFWVRAIFAL